MSVKELIEWAETTVKPKAKKAWAGQGDFLPGSHCGFCRAKFQCRARSDFANDAVVDDFKAPALLSDEELLKAFKRSTLIKSWISDVEEHLLAQAKDGKPPAGYILGSTNTKRKISDPERAKMLLIKQGFPEDEIVEAPELKTVAQLEKIAGKEKLAGVLGDLIFKPEGEPKLVESKIVAEFS